ncbi:putative protein kinase RLK-Pelle-LRR-IX family [Helianthus annuus]|uniref:Putative concanavalin A-like lectin/glucanase domain, Serine/threonine-protein kinase, Ulk1/Ulk2 n=1 Tax=Helianthus annuus TaxID=4232 RepID=A0A251S773_HELAN|nr:receptor protein kinase TMK1 [Helianthus annuus]KAF5765342.1 putative protein kinase RLK-Pelle-LRR-IX family [Helianthus annuus]KAJ0451886.1 putative protein kinase RLK-Pelle-LRR-IX family [Helianthus annuus]KAJ0456598.1 putative protein kinase RLK-Pelle-LRR-IX family [Helianthus annuus]KAJ0473771.1 putative protein kinase RLK-Pelle-LRR-IX family [Helianthus annuus]KAJ0649347.1 putative protein kinase RLK-Pelle-LRR-IX family [Helianthus annuus]
MCLVGVCVYQLKRKCSTVFHPCAFVSCDEYKIIIDDDYGGLRETLTHEGNMVISIQDLKKATNNFSQLNILGRGGSATVYQGELKDGTKIAVKRTESVHEFKSEVSVLTKVRHTRLVALRGYCLDGDQRLLLAIEYMPQGTLTHFLFDWKKHGLKPLEWRQRLMIALDVARGVEYLHCFGHQSFIHRDLKPCNILLGNDMRAKVADFGLARPLPLGKDSFVTKVAGTFGYFAPEYAEMGEVSTKIDVYSFGVILMELITGRRARGTTLEEESVPLVKWFLQTYKDEVTFRKAVDPALDLDEETLACVSTVAELAAHCCASKPHKRPNMSQVVNVLSYLVDPWNMSEPEYEGVDIDMNLDTGSFTSLDGR